MSFSLGSVFAAAAQVASELAPSALSYYGSRSLNKKSVSQNLAASKDLQSWQALNLPSLQKQGLIDAGYNPILAANPEGGTSTISGNGSFTSSPMSSALSMLQQKKDLEIADGTVHKLEADINNTQSTEWNIKQDTENKRKQGEVLDILKAQENAKLVGLQSQNANTALRLNRENKVIMEHPELVEKAFKNNLERGGYVNSLGHAIGEDVFSALQLLLNFKNGGKAPIHYNYYQ